MQYSKLITAIVFTMVMTVAGCSTTSTDNHDGHEHGQDSTQTDEHSEVDSLVENLELLQKRM